MINKPRGSSGRVPDESGTSAAGTGADVGPARPVDSEAEDCSAFMGCSVVVFSGAAGSCISCQGATALGGGAGRPTSGKFGNLNGLRTVLLTPKCGRARS